MNTLEPWQVTQIKRIQASLIGHGILIILVALSAGIMLGFSLVEGIKLWPFVDISMEIPGSTRGWKAAHIGGLLNGIMMIAVALCLPKVRLVSKRLTFTYWAFVLTGWGNTIFYWAGNFSMNRGLSVGATRFGEGDIFGAVAYLVVSPVMLITIMGCWVLMRQSFNAAKKTI